MENIALNRERLKKANLVLFIFNKSAMFVYILPLQKSIFACFQGRLRKDYTHMWSLQRAD